MGRRRRRTGLAGLAAAGAAWAGVALHDIASPPDAWAAAPARLDPCFRSQDFQAFKAINDHSFYIRVRLHDIYRIDLSGACPVLTAPDARLDVVEHGGTLICSPLDWQLRVASPSDPPIGCVVERQVPLTPAEAAAIPYAQRP